MFCGIDVVNSDAEEPVGKEITSRGGSGTGDQSIRETNIHKYTIHTSSCLHEVNPQTLHIYI